MRLLDPTSIKILASHPEFPKTHLSNAWSEVFKFLASGQNHPKMFIDNYHHIGNYLKLLYEEAILVGCNLDIEKVKNLNINIRDGFNSSNAFINTILSDYFDDNYLFSDVCSLYYKGTNIFPDIFGNKWRKYVPVENRKEIIRQLLKTETGRGFKLAQVNKLVKILAKAEDIDELLEKISN